MTLKERLQEVLNSGNPAPLLLSGAGTLLVRMGIDGTSKWHQGVEVSPDLCSFFQVFTISPFQGQSPSLFNPVGYFLGHEAKERLGLFLDEAGWDAELAAGVVVMVHGRPTRAKFFICGDHQLHVRMGAARSTSSYQERCPFCDTKFEVCLLSNCTGPGVMEARSPALPEGCPEGGTPSQCTSYPTAT